MYLHNIFMYMHNTFLGTLGPSSTFSCNALFIIYVKCSRKITLMINKLV